MEVAMAAVSIKKWLSASSVPLLFWLDNVVVRLALKVLPGLAKRWRNSRELLKLTPCPSDVLLLSVALNDRLSPLNTWDS